MTTIPHIYGPDKFGLSFELFPPKTDKGVETLFRHTQRLIEFEPAYITCTYGAGGSTQDRTLGVISEVYERYDVPVATHLTCVGSTAEQLREYLQRGLDSGVQNVVALRGDPPQGQAKFQATAGGFAYANELVEFVKNEFPTMGIAVGGYPETHQEAVSPEDDLQNLKRKVDAGADVIITQLFYDNADFFGFRERCEQIGINIPIVPGLLPVTNGAQIQRIAALCGAKLPSKFVEDLNKFQEDPAGQFEVGVEFATQQTEELISAGIPGIHFYVLNKSEAAERVLGALALPR